MRTPVAAGLVLVLGAAGAAFAASARLEAEITRLRSAVPEVVPESSRGGVMPRLERAGRALAAGQTYLALYDLQVVYEAEAGYRLVSKEKSVPDLAAFSRMWTDLGAPAAPPPGKAPVLFVEALAQSAEGRAPATYRASHPYAEDAGIGAGLYYLGESHGMVKFADLCRSLGERSPGRAPQFGSIERWLAVHEKNVVKSYEAAPAQQRPQFAGVNVTIKLARTLDEQRRYEGALLQYLVSVYRHAMVVGGVEAGSVEALEARVKSARMPAGVDHSIGEFFLQLASATLEGPDASPVSASVVLDRVLPAYFEVVGK